MRTPALLLTLGIVLAPGARAAAQGLPPLAGAGYQPNDSFIGLLLGYNDFFKPEDFDQKMSQFGLEWGGSHTFTRVLFGSGEADYGYLKWDLGFYTTIGAGHERTFFEPRVLLDIWYGFPGDEGDSVIHLGLEPGARLRYDATASVAAVIDLGINVLPLNFGTDPAGEGLRKRGTFVAWTANVGAQYRY